MIARPFHAGEHLVVGAGPHALAARGEQLARAARRGAPPRPATSRGVTRDSTVVAVLEVAGVGHAVRVREHERVRPGRAPRAAARASTRRTCPPRPRCRRRATTTGRPPASDSSRSRNATVSTITSSARAASGPPIATDARVDRRAAAPGRTASSRSAAPATSHRPSSARTRRRGDRRCRPRPCRAPSRRTRSRAASPNGNRPARASRSWLELDGNFGAPPSPPCFGSQRSASCLPAAMISDASSLPGIAAERAAPVVLVDALQAVDQRERVVLGVGAARLERVAHRARADRRSSAGRTSRLVGKYVPRKYGRPSGRQNARQRPAAALAHHHDRVHEDRVDVGPLLAIDLDVDEQLVHQLRGRRVLEALVRHHVAPVARRVADRDEHRLVEPLRLGERLLAPRPPLDRVVGVLPQVRRALGGEAIRHGRLTPGLCSGQVSEALAHAIEERFPEAATHSTRPAFAPSSRSMAPSITRV